MKNSFIRTRVVALGLSVLTFLSPLMAGVTNVYAAGGIGDSIFQTSDQRPLIDYHDYDSQ